MTPDKNNLIVSGKTETNGGEFDRVEATGDVTINGDLSCKEIRCTGNINIRGSIAADDAKLDGNMTIDGKLSGRNVSMDGKIGMAGIAASELEIGGFITVSGDVRATALTVKGGFDINGLLEAANLDIKLYTICKAVRIEGDRIDVRKGNVLDVLNKWIPSKFQSRLTADIISGDRIMLENTTAGLVTGNGIVIGPGCEIGKVVYTNRLSVDSQSRVAQVEEAKR